MPNMLTTNILGPDSNILGPDCLQSSTDLVVMPAVITKPELFAAMGALGALIMFLADLILYYPTPPRKGQTNAPEEEDTCLNTAAKSAGYGTVTMQAKSEKTPLMVDREAAGQLQVPAEQSSEQLDSAARSIQQRVAEWRTAKSYFSQIDPGGDDLKNSSMQDISVPRVMLGGALGPLAVIFYQIGFLGIYAGLMKGAAPANNLYCFLAFLTFAGFSLMMGIGAVYHSLFAYTCFISKQIAHSAREKASLEKAKRKAASQLEKIDEVLGKITAFLEANDALEKQIRAEYEKKAMDAESFLQKRKAPDAKDIDELKKAVHDEIKATLEEINETALKKDVETALVKVLEHHQKYLRYIYTWAATPAGIASFSFVYCCLTQQESVPFPWFTVFFVPAVSAPLKKLLKKTEFGGIMLCGGLTNLWNLLFFAILGLTSNSGAK